MPNKFKYSIVADLLREQIRSGHYCIGDKLPTEYELVEQYGFSRQTVRQALKHLEDEALIERRQGSGSLVINAAARAGRADAKTVAVVTTYIGEYIFPTILRAIEETLEKNHFLTMIFATKNKVHNERRILEEILETSIDGLIVEGTKTALPNPNIDLYLELQKRGVPVVFVHGWYPELTDTVHVIADDHQGGFLATDFLISKGHRNIAGIFKCDDIQGHQRYGGYTEALLAHNLPILDDNVLWYTTESKELVGAQGKKIVSSASAVICYNDEVAAQLINALKGEGVQVPGDISVMGFDNSSLSELSTPRISSCSQDKPQVGLLAAKKIVSLINGVGQESSVLPWRVVEKETVREVE
ncbi:MAG: GntR family transcriptional regulator [Lachnospiraceae bacterium]|jgi:GntR family transcriptional regulator of arabinose operon|nr:GntR family transcriptional regulator [Lachnospiraceae bacterium]